MLHIEHIEVDDELAAALVASQGQLDREMKMAIWASMSDASDPVASAAESSSWLPEAPSQAPCAAREARMEEAAFAMEEATFVVEDGKTVNVLAASWEEVAEQAPSSSDVPAASGEEAPEEAPSLQEGENEEVADAGEHAPTLEEGVEEEKLESSADASSPLEVNLADADSEFEEVDCAGSNTDWEFLDEFDLLDQWWWEEGDAHAFAWEEEGDAHAFVPAAASAASLELAVDEQDFEDEIDDEGWTVLTWAP